jgi:putative addiction module CopG family antidote
MNVNLSEEARRIVRSGVESGRFRTEGDVLDAALRLLEQQGHDPEESAAGMTEDEFERTLLEAGLLTSIPPPADPSAPAREFQPIEIVGEPLSETILRERR